MCLQAYMSIASAVESMSNLVDFTQGVAGAFILSGARSYFTVNPEVLYLLTICINHDTCGNIF